MAYVLPEDLQQAKRMDLLTYLQTFEPQELVRVSGNTYCTREHDSLKISNGMWHWFSRKIGGKSALDYLILVKGLALPQAVEQILGRAAVVPPSFHAPQKGKESAKLLLPDRATDNRIVTRYLRDRGIHPEILDYCYRNRLIFESLPYHSAVFAGYDESGTPRHANIRSTKGNFKGDATGSGKHYSFHIPALSDHVHIFEAAIDLLSYATMERMLYTQLFQRLYYRADFIHGGRLPVHVHFVMDEFANVALPDEFDKILSTMRSREISVSIIIQNMAQLKALFEKQWESIAGNRHPQPLALFIRNLLICNPAQKTPSRLSLLHLLHGTSKAGMVE